MQSLLLILATLVAIVSATPTTQKPRVIPIDSSPWASDLWALSGRSLITRFAINHEEMGHKGDFMIKFLTCVLNVLQLDLVKRYKCFDFWNVHENYYIDALESFGRCSLLEQDVEYEICQRQNFSIAIQVLDDFYSDLRMQSNQSAYKNLPLAIDNTCRPRPE